MKDRSRRQPPRQADLFLHDDPDSGMEEAPAARPGAPGPPSGDLELRPAERSGGRPAASPRPSESMVAVARSETQGVARRWLWLVLLVALPLGGLAGYFLRGEPPLVVLEPEVLDFGEARVGGVSEPLTIEIRNHGERALEIERALLQGDMAAEVTVVEDTCSGGVILAQQGCRLALRFAPADGGPRKGELRIFGNAASSPDTVPMIGLGVAPRLRFEPEEHDFGSQTVGLRSRPVPVYLANEGSAPLAVKAVNSVGQGGADFVAVVDDCTGQTLGPGERCAIGFAFIPTVEGERRATLQVLSDALDVAGEGIAGSRLFGIGLPQEPALGLDPARLDFAPRLLGDAGPEERVTLTNEGTGPLTVERLEIEGAEAGFRVSGNCRKALQPSESCTVAVRFTPAREGPARAFLEIHHDAGEGLHRVALVGTGIEPRLELDPDRLTFDEVAVRAQGEPRTLRLANGGSGPLQVRDLRLSGVDARSYQIRTENCSGQTLAPADECAVTVGFSPLRDGSHRAELVVRHSAGNGMSRLPLTGIGVSAQLSLDRSALDFGNVRVGQDERLTVEIRSSGRADLRVRRVAVTGNFARAFELRDDTCSGRTLAPGERCSVAVRFAPTEAGARNAALEIDHDAPNGPSQVGLRAAGTPPPRPDIRLEPFSLEFDAVTVGESRTLKVRLANPGDGVLELRGLRLTGRQTSDFGVAEDGCGSRVAPGGQCTIGVRFAPTAAGPRAAVLLVEHNAPGGTNSVELHGEGLAPAPVPPVPPSP